MAVMLRAALVLLFAAAAAAANVTVPLAYTTLLRSSAKLGPTKLAFGQILNKWGQPVMETVNGSRSAKPLISNEPDFSSLLEVTAVNGHKRLFMVTHFEFPRPSSQFVVELRQEANGTLTPRSMKPVDWSSLGGLWIPCAGVRTPWMSHMAGEEYEPDARPFSEGTDLASLKAAHRGEWDWIDVENFMRYFNMYPATMTYRGVVETFNPYRYGHIVETTVQADGVPTVEKWYTMGRASWEMAYVMPDQRTVYATDDGLNGVFFKFVADRAGDMSSGRLYAARFRQLNALNGGSFTLSWVYLGKGDNDELKDLGETTKFSDIFETAVFNAASGRCPPGFRSINQDENLAECLKLKPGMAQAAAFLETRRYAALKGATSEFNKWEGLTFDPKRRQLYTAVSSIRYGMENNAKKGSPNPMYDIGGPNHVRLPYNKFGCVYRLPVDRLSSAYAMYPLTCGRANANASDFANGASLDSLSGPDNVAFIPELDTLLIAEDGDYHENDVLWAYNLQNRSMKRIVSAPWGAEVTSPYFYPNINGWSYMMAVMMHPYEWPFEARASEPLSSGTDGTVGYFTWKASDTAGGKGAVWEEIEHSQTDAEKHAIRGTTKLTILK